MKTTVQVWTASADADGGTQGATFATEREGQDWILDKLDKSATREALDEFMASGGDFFDFVNDHCVDPSLDTFNLEPTDLALDVPADPRLATAIELLSSIGRDDDGDGMVDAAAMDRIEAFLAAPGVKAVASAPGSFDALAREAELDEDSPEAIVKAALDLLDETVAWTIAGPGEVRFLIVGPEQATVYRARIDKVEKTIGEPDAEPTPSLVDGPRGPEFWPPLSPPIMTTAVPPCQPFAAMPHFSPSRSLADVQRQLYRTGLKAIADEIGQIKQELERPPFVAHTVCLRLAGLVDSLVAVLQVEAVNCEGGAK